MTARLEIKRGLLTLCAGDVEVASHDAGMVSLHAKLHGTRGGDADRWELRADGDLLAKGSCALVDGPDVLRLDRLPLPEIGAYEVDVELTLTGNVGPVAERLVR